MEVQTRRILNDNLNSLFLRFSIPAMAGMFVESLFNFADGIFAGQLISPAAVGAISLAYPIILFNSALRLLIAQGAGSLLSRALGVGDDKTANQILGSLIMWIGMISLIYSAAVWLFAPQIVGAIGGRGEILRLGERYVRIVAAGFVVSSLGLGMNMLLRSEGRIQEAMLILTAGSVANIILDPIFILVFSEGIDGLASATVLSQFLLFALQLIYMFRGKTAVRLTKRTLRFNGGFMKSILPVGLSSFSLYATLILQQVLLYTQAERYGGNMQVAALGAGFRTFMLAFLPLYGIGQGLQPILGINFGAGQLRRVREAFVRFSLYGSVISVGFWLMFMVFPDLILGWFLSDPKVAHAYAGYFRVASGVFMCYALIITEIVFFQALGKGLQAVTVVLLRQLLLFVPAVMFLPVVLGNLGIWLSIPIADVIALGTGTVLCIVEYRHLFAPGFERKVAS